MFVIMIDIMQAFCFDEICKMLRESFSVELMCLVDLGVVFLESY